MRLFLSSQDLGKYGNIFAELVGDNKKLAFIKNAQDDLPKIERNFSLPEKQRMFESFGFKFEEVDLRDYFGKTNELKNKLLDFGAVWCSGGNTFILRRAMKISGFDELIKELLLKDKITYGGSSAGSCITAPSLKGIQYGDRPKPNAVPSSYPIKETIWVGLNLVPFMIVPHYNSEWFQKQAKEAIKYLKKHQIDYKPLEDGQVIVVSGNRIEFLQ